jgi:hypothetical protein
MSEPLDDRIMVRAKAGRWRASFRVRPDVTPPTEDEAAALAAAIVDALAVALGAAADEAIEVPQ